MWVYQSISTLINLNSRGPLYSFKSYNCLAYVFVLVQALKVQEGFIIFVRENKNEQILEIKLCEHSSNLNNEGYLWFGNHVKE